MRTAYALVLLAGCNTSPSGAPIAGLPGFSEVRRVAPDHCGGVAVEVNREPAAVVTPADAPLADLLGLEFPRGLDFGPAQKAASQERFAIWTESLRQRTVAASERYRADSSAAGAARLAQTFRYSASLLIHAEIPADIRAARSREALAAYCGNLTVVAQPMIAQAAAAASLCAERAATEGSGWWTHVCATSVAIAP